MKNFIILTGGSTRTPVRIALDKIVFYDGDKVGSIICLLAAGPIHVLEDPSEIDDKIKECQDKQKFSLS